MEKDSDIALLLAYGGAKDSNTKDLGFLSDWSLIQDKKSVEASWDTK